MTLSPEPDAPRRSSIPIAGGSVELERDMDSFPPTVAAVSSSTSEGGVAQQSSGRRRTLDERREQNRLTVQRFYYRKKLLLQDMRDEEVRLTGEFNALRALVSDTSNGSQQSELTQLILLKETLQHQNEFLRRMLSSQSQTIHLFQRMYTASRHQQVVASTRHRTAYECIPQVSAEACNQLIESALREIAAQKSAHACSPRAVALSVFGWVCQYEPSSDDAACGEARLLLSKRLAPLGIPPLELAKRTLGMWTSSVALHAHLFPAYLHSTLRVLQQIDELNFIVLQTIEKSSTRVDETDPVDEEAQGEIPSGDAIQKVHTVLHVSLVVLGNGYTTLIHSVPSTHYELNAVDDDACRHPVSAEWIDLFNWCTVTEGANGSEVTWGGKTTTSPSIYFGMSAYEWLIYELTRAVRWETTVTDTSVV